MTQRATILRASILLWLFIALPADVALLPALFVGSKPMVAWVGVASFFFMIHFVWLSLAHMIVCVVLRTRLRTSASTNDLLASANSSTGPAAILLCTRDDWLQATAASCVRALRGGDHLFICDDSQDSEAQSQINDFAMQHHHQCSVVRRQSLRGYKAGNLNHWLRCSCRKFTYFLVVDHDNEIGSDIISRGIYELDRNPSLAFIQFVQREASAARSKFAEDLGLSVRLTWWLQSLRVAFGLPISFGHGVLYRTNHVNEIGGFPEIITEDLGVTLRCLRQGRVGAYDLHPLGSESVPDDYLRFRARYVRWCVGTIQCWIRRETRPRCLQLRSHLTWDGLLQALTLLYPLVAFLTVLAWSLAMVERRSLSPSSNFIISITTIVAMIGPTLPLIIVAHSRKEGLRAAAIHSAVYLAMIVPVACAVIAQLTLYQPSFVNSGNRSRQTTRIFDSDGAGTRVVEVFVFLWLVGHAPDLGFAGWPLLVGITSSLIFQAFSWSTRFVSVVKYAVGVSFVATAVSALGR